MEKNKKKPLFHFPQHCLLFYLSSCSELITQLSECVCVLGVLEAAVVIQCENGAVIGAE